jgi:hypothetical protein
MNKEVYYVSQLKLHDGQHDHQACFFEFLHSSVLNVNFIWKLFFLGSQDAFCSSYVHSREENVQKKKKYIFDFYY